MNERTVSSRYAYQERVLNLRVDEVELDDGRRTVREVVEHRGAVAMVAVDDEGQVLLVRQFRKPLEKLSLEIPAGTREPGEEARTTAERELAEETGFRGRNWTHLNSFYSAPGFCTEQLDVYLVEELEAVSGAPDDDEYIELLRAPLNKALEWVSDGTICDAKSIIGLLLAERRRGEA